MALDQPAEGSADDAPVWALAWDGGKAGAVVLHTINDIRHAYENEKGTTWVDLTDPSEEVVQELAGLFNIHALVVEDILERNQRAKIEISDDTLHLVMFALRHEDKLFAHEFEIVLGHRFLLTVHDARGPSPREAPFQRRAIYKLLLILRRGQRPVNPLRIGPPARGGPTEKNWWEN